MIEFTLNNQKIEFDETVDYADFYLDGGEPKLTKIDFKLMLEKMQDGEIPFESDYFVLVSRWVNEAPRKRSLKKMREEGMHVFTSEILFDGWEEGDNFIDSLERSGILAAKICEAYGVDPASPIRNSSDSPVSTKDFIDVKK